MKVIVDEKVPYIKDTLELLGFTAVYVPGDKFSNEIIKDADALVIRTRTKCNEELLKGSSVRFIATATIGFDHIDTSYCKRAGIEWTNAAGCNSGAVEQYIHSVLLLLQRDKGLSLKDSTIGVIGVGHVGSRIARVAGELGMKVLLNDPPRKDDGEEGFVELNEIMEKADVITFHTPLTKDGKHSTYHLADANFFSSLKRRPYIINTSRGEVIDTPLLIENISSSKVSDAIIDVWENEPHIDMRLLNMAYISTPHIAGYSADGKINATRSSLLSLCQFFGLNNLIYLSLPPSPFNKGSDYYNEGYNFLEVYNPLEDSAVLKSKPENFEKIRGDYKLRREL